ncbi:hypothetical protein O0I10_003749 [Lichtheimia ornata]|uniref:RRM domain-containing protein n=1 Tax=Lichtheimia ornata TaxID=688661 RepID=A0AAD7VAR9_9FUNG|nr:uncharacterized protein O0I10_003749 [Lichtheimia ornata]KAJ8660701.1 hypothetical protein O0I10_003749 [Lichtheimia ornata]
MKRSHESTNQGAPDASKKQRISSPYSDMYSQYSAMNPAAAAMMMGSQYPANMFSQANAASTKGFVNQFNNGMYSAMSGYGGAAAAAAAAAQGMLRSPNAIGVSAAGANGNTNTMMSNQGNNSNTVASNNGHEMSRTIYLGNVSKELTSTDILNYVKSGTIESFRMLHEKSCAFISFLDPLSAQLFYQEYANKPLSINDHELRIGWGRAQSVPDNVQFAAQNGATRNVYLGNLDETVTEESLRSDLGKFGEVEHVRVIPEKRIAFVHFTSIYYAVKCVSSLQQDPAWLSRRINYGKDRCSSRSSSTSTPSMDQQQQYGFTFQHPFRGTFGFDSYGGANSGSAAMMSQAAAAYGMAGAGANNPAASLRTLYLGNIPSEATCEDLCNSIRGGVLFQIRYLTDKHIAFVTFIDANAAMNVFNHACTVGIVVKAKRLRVGWGKPCNIPTSVVVAVQNGGASRNIYIGGIEEDFDEEKLRSDWSEYGEIELINALREKSCVFVNFTHINNAMKALAAMKEHPVYKKYKINYGKDRCGNPPKKFLQATGSQQQQQQGTQYPVIPDQ